MSASERVGGGRVRLRAGSVGQEKMCFAVLSSYVFFRFLCILDGGFWCARSIV